MAVYLVTWDLNREKPSYAQARAAFIANLEKLEHTKDPSLDSVRFVSTTWSASQVSEHAREQMDDNDRVFVTRLVSGSHAGWLSKLVWEWINARLS